MKKNKKILYAAVSGCVILAGAATAVVANAGYPKASGTGSSTGTQNGTNTPPTGETPPEPPSGSGTPPDGTPPNGTPPDGGQGGQGAPDGMAKEPASYSAVNTYDKHDEASDEKIASTKSDENAVLVQSGAKVTMKNITLDRTSSDSTGGDSASFYGVGAGMLVTDGVLDVSGSTIHTDSAGGAGVFAYKSGVINVSDTTIYTKQDTSGGIHAAGGGTVNAENVTVTTEGNSSAAIRSDRGGGTMKVVGGTYTSNGSGSPVIYCTADITVHDADLTANGSEAVCIEGLNSLKLKDCNLTGNMPENSQNDCIWNVVLYQSMSGDSEVGNSSFTMEGGTLTTKNGGVFYTTNTESTFKLSNVNINYAARNDFFLKCTGNSNARGWGQKGSNGADCTFTAQKQNMQGDIIWDSISKLDFHMSDGSVLTGAFVQDESNAGSGGSGYANVTIDASSKWIVTGNSTVSKLNNLGTVQDADGNTVTVQKADGTMISKGDSKYKITVVSESSAGNTQDVTNNTENNSNNQDANTSSKESTVKKLTRTVKAGKSIKVKVGKSAKVAKVSNKKIVKAGIKGNSVVIKGKKTGTSVVAVKRSNISYKITVKVK